MGYNKGDTYEEKIYDICKAKNLIYPGSMRGGAGNLGDITLDHNGTRLIVEVKEYQADYGQKYMQYINGKWTWDSPDRITDYYDGIGLLDEIDPTFVPYNSNTKGYNALEWRKNSAKYKEDLDKLLRAKIIGEEEKNGQGKEARSV